MAKVEKTIESAFVELNQIITDLDKEDVSLEKSFELYQAGLTLVQYCNDKIEKVEKKIIIVNEAGDVDEL
ncbi:MAG: exodeoxyribonuclease VII small subunit [Clostridiales bacterium]|nr:exodeoxyribonuclease VII small subunit [Clostridiales bacterium]